jgi:hypothetical protein
MRKIEAKHRTRIVGCGKNCSENGNVILVKKVKIIVKIKFKA